MTKKDDTKKTVEAPKDPRPYDPNDPQQKAIKDKLDRAVADYEAKNPRALTIEELLGQTGLEDSTPVVLTQPKPDLVDNVDLTQEIGRLTRELKNQQAMNARDRAETKKALELVDQVTRERDELRKKVDLVRAEQTKLINELTASRSNEAALRKGFEQSTANVETLHAELEKSNQKRKNLRTALAEL